MSDTTPCDPFAHRWKEVYYGYECIICEQFVPFGCEPWRDWEEDLLEEEDFDDV